MLTIAKSTTCQIHFTSSEWGLPYECVRCKFINQPIIIDNIEQLSLLLYITIDNIKKPSL